MEIFGLATARALTSMIQEAVYRKKAKADVPAREGRPDAGAQSDRGLAAPRNAGLRHTLQKLAKKVSAPELGRMGQQLRKMAPRGNRKSEPMPPAAEQQQGPVSVPAAGTAKKLKAFFRKKRKQPEQGAMPATVVKEPLPARIMNTLRLRPEMHSHQPPVLDRRLLQELDAAMRQDLASLSPGMLEDADTAPIQRLRAAAQRILHGSTVAGQAGLETLIDDLKGTVAARVLLQYGERAAVNSFLRRVVQSDALTGEQIAEFLSAGNMTVAAHPAGSFTTDIEIDAEQPEDDAPIKFLFTQWSIDRATAVKDLVATILQSGRLTTDQKSRLVTGAHPGGVAHVHLLFTEQSNALAKGYLDTIFNTHRQHFTVDELRRLAERIVAACVHAERDNTVDFTRTWRTRFDQTITALDSPWEMKELLRMALEREALRGARSGRGGIAWNIPLSQERAQAGPRGGTTSAGHGQLRIPTAGELQQLREELVGLRDAKGGIAWDIPNRRKSAARTASGAPFANALPVMATTEQQEAYDADTESSDESSGRRRHRNGMDGGMRLAGEPPPQEAYDADAENSDASLMAHHPPGDFAGHGQTTGRVTGPIGDVLERADEEVRMLNRDMQAIADANTQVRRIVQGLFERVHRLERRLNPTGDGETPDPAYQSGAPGRLPFATDDASEGSPSGAARRRPENNSGDAGAPADLNGMATRLEDILDGLRIDRSDVAAGCDAMIDFVDRVAQMEQDIEQLENDVLRGPNRDMLAQVLTTTWQKQQILSLTPGENSRINELVHQFYADQSGGDWSARVENFLTTTYFELQQRPVSLLDNLVPGGWRPSRDEMAALLPRLATPESRAALRMELDRQIEESEDNPRQQSKVFILRALLDELDGDPENDAGLAPVSGRDIEHSIRDLRDAYARLALRGRKDIFLDELRTRLVAARFPGR
ncbi:hypothetical protein [Noviherbaspirillum sp.]|uniref:hypothetical protein n=1 Tax=Noviherbaspirillum sp. TaxID=1926288 RepID=UPI002FE40065